LLNTNKKAKGRLRIRRRLFFPHGEQKLFGWFGGVGFTGTMTYKAEKSPLTKM